MPATLDSPSLSGWMDAIGQMDTPPVETPPVTPPAEKPAVPPVETPPTSPVEKPPEPPPVEKPVTPPVESDEDKWPRSAKDWEARKSKQNERLAAVQKERDAIKVERDSVKAEIEKLKQQGPSPELDSLKKERDELSERLRLVDVREHPKFKAYFDNKFNSQYELAKRIVGQESATAIVEALQMPEGISKEQRIEELTAGLSNMKQAQLGGVLTSLAQITQERDSEIANSKSNYEKFYQENEANAKKAAADRIQLVEKTFSEQVKRAQDPKEGMFLFQKRDGDDAWNKSVDDRVTVAKSLFAGTNKPEVLANASMYAASFPAVLQWAKEQHETVKKLEAQVKSLSAASPTVQGGDKKPADGAPKRVEIKKAMNPMEAASAWVNTIQPEWQR